MTLQVQSLAEATDEQLADGALGLGGLHFDDLVNRRRVNGGDLFVEVGAIVDGAYVRWGSKCYGNQAQAEKFAVNTSADGGKLATVVRYRMDSGDAYRKYGDEISDGPGRWKGGVYLKASVQLSDGTWRTCELVCAASGVQSEQDAAVARGVVSDLAATWEQRELDRADQPTASVDS